MQWTPDCNSGDLCLLTIDFSSDLAQGAQPPPALVGHRHRRDSATASFMVFVLRLIEYILFRAEGVVLYVCSVLSGLEHRTPLGFLGTLVVVK